LDRLVAQKIGMRARRTIVTAGILGLSLAATVAVFLFEASRPVTSPVLISLPGDALVKIEIGSPGGKTILERGEPRWNFVKPVKDWANEQEMRAVVDGLCHLPIRETIANGEVKDSILGLSSSKATSLRLDFMDGVPQAENILFGRAGPFENTVYARLERHPERNGVHLVETPLRPLLLSPGNNFANVVSLLSLRQQFIPTLSNRATSTWS